MIVHNSDDLVGVLNASIQMIKERKAMNGMNGNQVNGAGVLAPTPYATTTAQTIAATNNGNGNTQKPPDVYRAISEVQKQISRDGISKGRRNEQQGYGFRGIDDVMNALSSLLADADLCILPRILKREQDERATAKGGVLYNVVVEVAFEFVSARDGSKHVVSMFGEAMDSGDKATNKAMSAAYKYACLQVFCIPTEAMQDADYSTPEPTSRQPKNPPAPKQPNPAQQAVAEHKIASGNAAASIQAPWKSLGGMQQRMATLRDLVGEVEFYAELARYGFSSFDDIKKAVVSKDATVAKQKAIEIHTHLVHLAGGKAVA